jgi:hypothetical protein
VPTFLQLVNWVASDSATFNESDISTVVGQTGRKAKVVRWTSEAWLQVQNAHREWLWMQSEFDGSTVASTARYAGTDFNDTFSGTTIDRFSQWDCALKGENRFKLYLPADGVASAGRLIYHDWRDFYAIHMNNGAANAKPSRFSIDPQNRLVLSPTPDAIYTVIGPYRKSAQTLAADSDEPEAPVDLHGVIVDIALQLLGTHDESPQQIPLWRMRESRLFCELEAQQLPKITWGGPLA